MSSQNLNSDRAIVIGGSIAGLLSAKILSNFFAEVIIIEKDQLPSNPSARLGVPQSLQPHVLLTKGYQIISEFFPGIDNELIKQGALAIDWEREFYSFGEAGWLATSSSPSELISVTCSRPLLEYTIRQKLQKNSQISFLEKHRVTGLILDRQKQEITGIKTHSSVSVEEKQLFARLVVDCSGRNSKAPQWLKNLGLTPPPETIVNANLGYATRRYEEPENFQQDWKVMLINHVPPDYPKLGYLARIERGEWIATLGGYERDFPPLDDRGFLNFARGLRNPLFYEAIKNAEPVSPIYAYRATANRLRHYEKINIPSGFIALGDSVCALCPVYGQGMTVSALASLVLQKWLRKTHKSFFNHKLSNDSFQRDLAQNNSFHWQIATSQDSRFLETQGKIKSSFFGSLFEGYVKKLQFHATLNPQVSSSLLEIGHSIKSPLHFFSPKLLWQLLKTQKH